MFSQTAKTWNPDRALLEKSLDLLYSIPFPEKEVQLFLQEYRTAGCPMVSHSEKYRSCYRPAYRIVHMEYVSLLPILCSIDKLLENEEFVMVAIDGPCASGKSTLGKKLSELYHCPLISMDDFFLRPEQRTPARLAEIGGNVDYERFREEVLVPLTAGQEVSYRPFSCSTFTLAEPITLPRKALTIIEGTYSLHPHFGDCYDLMICLTVSPEVQRQRILLRPEFLHRRFFEEWIPMENRYFETFGISEKCHLVL